MRTLTTDLLGNRHRVVDDRPMAQLAIGALLASLPAPAPAPVRRDMLTEAARAHGERMGWAFSEIVTRSGIGTDLRFAVYTDGNGKTWERSEAQLMEVCK
jgi:hypothetical protein